MLAPLAAGIRGIPEALLEASWTLGKGRLETFVRIVLPQLRPSLLAGAITTFAHTLGEFGVVLMIGGSIPGVTKVISIAIYERTEAQDFAQVHVYAAVLLVVSYCGVVLLGKLGQRPRRDKSR
jgi:molybdate transport system permease protein